MAKAQRPAVGRKPCESCGRAECEELIRCRAASWEGWRLVCGACWRKASGGVPDGDAAHPEYQYGGLWRFRKTDLTEPPERLLSACQLADVDAT